MLGRWMRSPMDTRDPEGPGRRPWRGRRSRLRPLVAAAAIAAGLTPLTLVPAPAEAATHVRQFAYVANINSDSVSVINTADNTVVQTIDLAPFGGDGPAGVAFTPSGTRAYVTNQFSNNVSVINTVNNTVVATIDLVGPSG